MSRHQRILASRPVMWLSMLCACSVALGTLSGRAEHRPGRQAKEGVRPDRPPLPDAPVRDEPGLILTTKPLAPDAPGAGFADKRVTRMAAIYVPLGNAPSPFTPDAPYSLSFEGDINMRLRDFTIFSAQGSGKLTVTINDKPVLDLFGDFTGKASEAVRLGKGKNHLVAVYAPMPTSDTEFRLFWATKTTPPEPVPPMVFSHSNADRALREGLRVREGKALVEEFRCTNCHGMGPCTPDARATPDVGADAPSLLDVGARLNGEWMAAWIDNPRALWPGAHMPRLFKPGPDGGMSVEAKDIAAWLATRGARDAGAAPDAAKADAGGLLFANLSCVACHNSPLHAAATGAEDGRKSLALVKAKFKPAALEEFLQKPSRYYPMSPMPDFRLGQNEAESLAAYLLSVESKPAPAVAGGDPTRGEALFHRSGCAACHNLGKADAGGMIPFATLPAADRPKASRDFTAEGWQRGCLSDDESRRGKAPDFSLTPSQRSAMLAYFSVETTSAGRYYPAEFADRQMAALRCTACHARDGRESLLATDLDVENQELHAKFPNPQQGNGEGIAPDQRAPMLTWAGEKLRPRWMQSFIAGEIPYKPRYYLRARMPGLGSRAPLLAEGLTQEHGCKFTLGDPPPSDKKLADVGQSLVGKTPNMSFGCVQCHAINQQAALAPFEAPAINFMYVTARLREDYYYRWIHDPLRVDPETKMPRFDDADGKTGVNLFGFDARQQYHAIWNYLLLGEDIQPPAQ